MARTSRYYFSECGEHILNQAQTNNMNVCNHSISANGSQDFVVTKAKVQENKAGLSRNYEMAFACDIKTIGLPRIFTDARNDANGLSHIINDACNDEIIRTPVIANEVKQSIKATIGLQRIFTDARNDEKVGFAR